MAYLCFRKISKYKTTIFLSIVQFICIWWISTVNLTQNAINQEIFIFQKPQENAIKKFQIDQKDENQKDGNQKVGNHKDMTQKKDTIQINHPFENQDRPGYMGRPVEIPADLPEDVLQHMELDNLKNGFHHYKSDLIGYYRVLPDARNEWCKAPSRFLKVLPSTSIIIPVHNEAWPTLIRTINSIIINSPPELVHEIVLVIDFTNLAHLKTQLEDHFHDLEVFRYPRFVNYRKYSKIYRPEKEYVSENYESANHKSANYKLNNYESVKVHQSGEKPGKVGQIANPPKIKIVRTNKREGLIRAKNLGARHATGEVLTFLDSHCECTKGWLEPLLDRIARNSTTVVQPIVDIISNETFEYTIMDPMAVGFGWELYFKPIHVPKREVLRRNHASEPFYSPVMLGGLFSISRAFFEKLGGYDSGLEIWGGENIEISFKAWMCGGSLEVVPCSHVGHIFSRNRTYSSTIEKLGRNLARIAKVWLDEYIEYFYERKRRVDVGDVSSQKSFRKKCKSFDWYLKTVYPELPIPLECPLHGEIKNVLVKIKEVNVKTGRFGMRNFNVGVDNMGKDHMGKDKIVKDQMSKNQMGKEQMGEEKIGKDEMEKFKMGRFNMDKLRKGNFTTENTEEIKQTVTNISTCLDSLGNQDGPVALYPCHGKFGHQYWLMTKEGEIVQNGYCLDFTGQGVYLHVCHGLKGNQHWQYSIRTKMISHVGTQLCLTVSEDRKTPLMKQCDGEDGNQVWILQNYDPAEEF